MESSFRASEAERYVDRYAPTFGADLARRIHTAHLLGEDPNVILGDGGSVSVKSLTTDLFGDPVEVLVISGAGASLQRIEPSEFASCRLNTVRQILERATTVELGVIAELSSSRIRIDDPLPPPAALLHAVLPGRFVDHARADAVLTLVSQPDPESVIARIFGERALYVPHAPAGAAVARRAIDLLRARGGRASVVIADTHGIFTWGDTAEESYTALVHAITLIEDYIAEVRGSNSRPTISVPDLELYSKLAPLFRGVLARVTARPWLLTWRTSTRMRGFCDRLEMTLLAQLGCAAPEHAVSTKWKPLVFGSLDFSNPALVRSRLEDALHAYASTYEEYVRRASSGRRRAPKLVDPWPRVILFEGLGALTLGRSAAEAERAADIYEHTASILDAAHAMQGFKPAGELEVFDAEHGPWARGSSGAAGLEGATEPRPLDGKIALVTGAAAGIGLATARALLKAGAHVVLTDRNELTLAEAIKPLAGAFPKRVTQAGCDVVIEAQVRRAMAHACTHFGGLDIVVSNAGSEFTGPLHAASGHTALRASLEVNLLGHQNVARAASEVFLLQSVGGALLFNASSAALCHAPDAGPYAVAEAALLALMRQYAIDLGPHGVRSNAVSPGRVRMDLWGDTPPPSRRGRAMPVEENFRANALGRETLAEDVGGAFVYLASAPATTGCVITVDGGIAAAFPR